jgi:multisubunit Na+/H+ antiporter MnhB subunit
MWWHKSDRDVVALGPLLYLAFAGAVAAGQPRDLARWLAADRRSVLAFFLATYFSGYLLLYAWYAPIGDGPRFVLALFLPVLYTCLRFLSHSSRLSTHPPRVFGRELHNRTFIVCVLFVLLIEVVTTFSVRAKMFYFGN